MVIISSEGEMEFEILLSLKGIYYKDKDGSLLKDVSMLQVQIHFIFEYS